MAHRLINDLGIDMQPHPYGTHIMKFLEFDRPFSPETFSEDKTFSVYVVLSYVPYTLDRKTPETMAFIVDKDGKVLNWNELCVSYAKNAAMGFRECIDMLEAM